MKCVKFSKKCWRKAVSLSLALLLVANFVVPGSIAWAENAQPGAVVINEVAWAGTVGSSTDEWIELYNTTASDINLAGWMIDDDNGDMQYVVNAGTIAAHSYFLIEDVEEATNLPADFVVGLSLANTGDGLVLKDALGNVIDSVNAAGGAWYAGNAANKNTMERISSADLQDHAANWGTNTAGNGVLDRGGNAINGTPREANSVTPVVPGDPAPQKAIVTLLPSTATPKAGDELQLAVKVGGGVNVFSYGLDFVYDPAVLEYVSAEKGAFLADNGAAETSFNAGLENNIGGKLVMAEARMGENRIGVTGDGVLFNVKFRVIGAAGAASNISVGGESFLADPSNDLVSQFGNAQISVEIVVAGPVIDLAAREGDTRYEIALSWNAPADGSDKYKVFRKKFNGEYVEISETNNLSFIDSDAVLGGGKIVPGINYEYRVKSVKNGIESVNVDVSQIETRGIKGDNNRTDRVDGRDLENLAKHFAETSASVGYDALVDTTYDGRIDGGDLIDIGASWALTYQE